MRANQIGDGVAAGSGLHRDGFGGAGGHMAVDTTGHEDCTVYAVVGRTTRSRADISRLVTGLAAAGKDGEIVPLLRMHIVAGHAFQTG